MCMLFGSPRHVCARPHSTPGSTGSKRGLSKAAEAAASAVAAVRKQSELQAPSKSIWMCSHDFSSEDMLCER